MFSPIFLIFKFADLNIVFLVENHIYGHPAVRVKIRNTLLFSPIFVILKFADLNIVFF